MKTRLLRKTKQLASALLTTLVICSILSIFVLYYLALVDQQSYLNARSQTWNMAIAVSEAGIEDAMAHLNTNYPLLDKDGWSFDSAAISYSRSNSLPGGGYFATIFITNSFRPYIISRAYVVMPPRYAAAAPSGFFAAGGTPSTVVSPPVNRAVQVLAKKSGLFLAALVSRNGIELNGNGITTDSYDSTDPNKSTNRQYDAKKYRGDMGDVATNLGVTDSLNVGNANIFGHAHTAPGSQSRTLQILPNGVVGAHSWAAINGSGVEPGWWLQDANFSFPTTDLPNTAGYFTPTNGDMLLPTVTMVTNQTGFAGYTNLASPVYTAVFTSGLRVGQIYYYALLSSYPSSPVHYDQIIWGGTSNVVGSLGNVLILGTNAIVVATNGLTGDETFTVYSDAWHTNGAVPLAPESSVTIYAGGTSCAVQGKNVFNQPGVPSDFIIFCAPSVTSVSFGGNAGFEGILVAPNANLDMNGSGSTIWDFSGCLMVNSVKLNGHFNFHYDESLSKDPHKGRYIVSAWNEIK